MNENIIYEQYTAGIYYFSPYGESQVMSIDYADLINQNLQSKILAQDIQLNNLKVTFYPIGVKPHQNVIYYKDGDVERWIAIAKGESTNSYKEYTVSAPSGKLTIAWDRSDQDDKWQINFCVSIVFVRPKLGRGKNLLFPPFSSSNVGKNNIDIRAYDDNQGRITLRSNHLDEKTPFSESEDSKIEEKENSEQSDDENIDIDLSLKKEKSMIMIPPSHKNKIPNRSVIIKKNN